MTFALVRVCVSVCIAGLRCSQVRRTNTFSKGMHAMDRHKMNGFAFDELISPICDYTSVRVLHCCAIVRTHINIISTTIGKYNLIIVGLSNSRVQTYEQNNSNHFG